MAVFLTNPYRPPYWNEQTWGRLVFLRSRANPPCKDLQTGFRASREPCLPEKEPLSEFDEKRARPESRCSGECRDRRRKDDEFGGGIG